MGCVSGCFGESLISVFPGTSVSAPSALAMGTCSVSKLSYIHQKHRLCWFVKQKVSKFSTHQACGDGDKKLFVILYRLHISFCNCLNSLHHFYAPADRDTETEVLLLENDINTRPFSQVLHSSSLICFPSIQIKIKFSRDLDNIE